MGAAAADLEARQLRILGRIAGLELAVQQRRLKALSISAPSEGEADAGLTEARLSVLLAARGVRNFAFRRVPVDYYDRPLDERRGRSPPRRLGRVALQEHCHGTGAVPLTEHPSCWTAAIRRILSKGTYNVEVYPFFLGEHPSCCWCCWLQQSEEF
jgi:hypothetical protein